MIMTIYLWHSSAMILVIALAKVLGNIGLDPVPTSAVWWLTRPVWLAAYTTTLALLMALTSRFERTPLPNAPATAGRQVVGACLACSGLALLAYLGIGGATPLALQAAALTAPFVGALVGGLLRIRPRRAPIAA
jgi:hypothetical protein